ncbi:leucyl aminopeptidase [Corynebacterium sp. HMSC28B08]|uniref:leucyl aminopeptidase n=1 Tax=Corynebacterium sp. HMSC28B08 TaxID=1581066 RepID=UPI0008A4D909|nr:leucyl aminopeptidase [Corynebacterium sp. HMSC28B08]
MSTSASTSGSSASSSNASFSDAASLSARGYIPALDTRTDGLKSFAPDEPIDTLVVAVFKGANGLELAGGPGEVLTSEQEIALWKLLTAVGAVGSKGEVTTVPGEVLAGAGAVNAEVASDEAVPAGPAVERILAVGLGDIEEVTDETIREAAGVASRNVKRPQAQAEGDNAGADGAGTSADGAGADGASQDVDTNSANRGAHVVSTLGMFGTEAALVGHGLGAYSYFGQRAGTAAIDRITVLTHGSDGNASAPEDTVKRARIVVESVCFARDLVNAPANELYPESYAAIAAHQAEEFGIKAEILDEKQLEEQGFGGIIGVGKGSARAPRLLRLTYTPAETKDGAPFVALVGKGITFDTGGISLKPGANMWDMISDMGGSAAVIASIYAVARLGVPVKVTATVPMAENMPSDRATRPGDILRHYGGLTTEVLNTDAEGRLVLADAIVRACEDKPDYLIETATLTGAQMVALGNRTPGVMGSIDFRDRVAMISQEVGENAWPMPLPAELDDALKSDVADLRNISTTRWGGMSVAGCYLSHFVPDDVEWVHIDIAGPAYNTSAPHGYTPKRGTGVPVRTIVETIERIGRG